jgi:hypothetical protein
LCLLHRLEAQLAEARRDVEQYRLEYAIQRATLDSWEERDQRLRAHFEQMDAERGVLQQQVGSPSASSSSPSLSSSSLMSSASS